MPCGTVLHLLSLLLLILMGPSLEKEVNHQEGEGSQEGDSDQPGTKRPTFYLPDSHMEVGGCNVRTGQVTS